MAERYTGDGYKIWLNRNDNKQRITDENIWAGNKPNDGKSKVTSGMSGPDLSYVIFDSWDDLLDAIEVEPTLSISANTRNVSDRPATVTISIYGCNTDWVLSDNQSWATLDSTSGHGNGSTTLRIEENSGSDDRSVKVTASYGKGKTKSVTITQSKSGELTLSAPSEVGPEQTVVTITVSSNTGWTLSITEGSGYSHFVGSYSGSGDGSVQLSVDQNTSATEDRDIVITATYGNKTTSITIRQNREAPYLTITPTSKTVSQAENTVQFTINSNVSWSLSVTSGESYARVDKTGGESGRTTVTMTIDENTTLSSRKAVITATYNGSNTKTATVTQAELVPRLSISASTNSVSVDGGLVTIEIYDCNVPWTLSDNQSWASLNKTSGTGNTKNIRLTINSNPDVLERAVTVTATYGNNQTKSVTITQGAFVPDPEIIIWADDTSIPRSGGTTNVHVEIINGVYDRYAVTTGGLTITETKIGLNRATLVVTFPVVSQDTIYTIIGYGKSQDGSKTVSKSVTLKQTNNWSLKDMDYVMFTYSWTADDGKDLDSFTFIDGLADSTSTTYGYTFEKGIGFGNGTKKAIPDSAGKEEYFLGADYDSTLIKMACDNTESGGEYTLINFKRLNECIQDAISKGEIPQSREVITIYLMGNWYNTRKNGKCGISFSAYKGDGCVVELVPVGQSRTIYTYNITGYDTKEEKSVENIEVFAGKGLHGSNVQKALTNYTTIAAFEYFLKENRFELITGEELRTLDGGRRYQEGARSTTQGDIRISGSSDITTTWDNTPTIGISLGDIDHARTYVCTLDNCVYTYYTGSTPYSQNLRIISQSCLPYDPSSPKGDPDITLTQLTDTSFKIDIPSGHIYSGTSDYGYRVYYKLMYDQSILGYETLKNLSPYIDINEFLQN